MSTIRTGSRLHFGLLNLGEGPRRFGGVGLMIDEPAVRMRVQPAERWSAEGPCAERALDLGRRWCQAAGRSEAFHIVVETCPSQHVGLGTGTQLGLTTARALAEACGQATSDALALARAIGRGARSALGIHGFAQGGFLIEGGKGPGTEIAPLLARADFPEEWRVLLVLPRGLRGTHGAAEVDAFAKLAGASQADALCRLVLLGMLPALHERDLAVFGEALHEFNRRVGEMFAPLQGGIYASPQSADIIRWLRAQSIRGVGQSSWGPAVFAIVEAEQAEGLPARMQRDLSIAPGEVVLTRGKNQGAATSASR